MFDTSVQPNNGSPHVGPDRGRAPRDRPLKDWPRPGDAPPEARYLLGGCAVLLALAVAIMIYSAVAPHLG